MTEQSRVVTSGPSGTTTAVTDASPFTAATTGMTSASGTLGALISLASFTYNIIKDHGVSFDCTASATDAGPSSGIKPDDPRKAELVGSFAISGIWYTHTRAFGSLLDRGNYGHEKAKTKKDFKSVYLCTIFPYQITWDLYKAVTEAAKPIAATVKSAKKLELLKQEKALYDDFYKEMDEYKAGDVEVATGRYENVVVEEGTKKTSTVIEKGGKVVQKTVETPALLARREVIATFRQKGPSETDVDYIKFLKELAVKDKQLELTIGVLETGIEAVQDERTAFQKQVDDADVESRKPVPPPELVFSNIQLRELSEVGGIKRNSYQNLKIKGKFGINPRQAPPYGFEVTLTWQESAPGYGWPGSPGSFRVEQKTEDAGGITLTPNGKLGKRFAQFMQSSKIA